MKISRLQRMMISLTDFLQQKKRHIFQSQFIFTGQAEKEALRIEPRKEILDRESKRKWLSIVEVCKR